MLADLREKHKRLKHSFAKLEKDIDKGVAVIDQTENRLKNCDKQIQDLKRRTQIL